TRRARRCESSLDRAASTCRRLSGFVEWNSGWVYADAGVRVARSRSKHFVHGGSPDRLAGWKAEREEGAALIYVEADPGAGSFRFGSRSRSFDAGLASA